MSEYVGRITIYTIVGCPHCKAAKARLKEENLKFIDVSVDRFPPHVREWVKEKTGKTSVPQIFFNAAYIGGNKELQAALDDPEKREAALHHLKIEPGDDVPLLPNPGEALTETDDGADDFECERDKLADLVEKLMNQNILGWNWRENFFLVKLFTLPCKKSIGGEALLSFISDQAESFGDPEKVAQELLDAKYIKKADPGKEFRGSDSEGGEFRKCGVYKVMGRDTPEDWKSLNTDEIASCVTKSADQMAQDIRKIVLKLFSSFLSESGKTVDYKGMGASPLWAKFKQMATQLQRVDIEKLCDDEKLAFFINIYNVLVIHATVEKGVPTSNLQRYKFFSSTSYVIGGYTLSLNDIENGILRSNRSSMATLYMKPFGSSDPRMKIILPQVDPRIHFALNCGAKSCPPIKTFSGAEVQSQLNLASNAYLENDDALIIDVENNSVQLSKLFQWYEVDFGSTKEEVMEWIRDHLAEPDKKKQVEEVLTKGDFTVSYLNYDWGNNSKEEE